MRDLIVIGGGEHARVVIEAARSVPEQWHMWGFVDPSPCHETIARLNVPRLGSDDIVSGYPEAAFILGVGNGPFADPRSQIVTSIGASSERWAVVIHRAAWVSPTAHVGHGTAVLAGAVVNSGARIGQHCILNTRTCIEHDAMLGDFVHAAPGSIVGGGAAVGERSYLGMGSLIRDHRTIGRSCLVAMGAAVTTNFGDDMTLVGVPASPHGRKRERTSD